jgi:hypothetical protein
LFPSEEGRPAFPFRVALGALIIKEELGISGDETVLQIQENPYLQYFLGFTSYQTDVPFDGSTLVHFRKRLNWTGLATINELLVKNVKDVHDKNTPDDSCPQKPATSNAGSGSDEKTHQVPGRIVSIRQPHVRPIVRGKARANVEFGAKVSMSVIDHFVYVDRISFDAYNEGGDLPAQGGISAGR